MAISVVSKLDVQIVAQKMYVKLNPVQLETVIEMYSKEKKFNPYLEWNNIVENCIKKTI
jgi:hypothetical protein